MNTQNKLPASMKVVHVVGGDRYRKQRVGGEGCEGGSEIFIFGNSHHLCIRHIYTGTSVSICLFRYLGDLTNGRLRDLW